jgi:hypothetical protein
MVITSTPVLTQEYFEMVSVTPEEFAAGRMSEEKVQESVADVLRDGFAVIENAADHACLDVLRERMNADTRELIASKHWGGAGRIEGHLQQGPPPFAPYIFPDVVSNPFGIQVSAAILGAGVYNSFYNGNTNTPGSGLQPVHRDLPELWPQWDGLHPPTSLVINVFPMDVHEHNGCTEVWPGSHHIPGKITDEGVAARSAHVKPIRAVAKKGTVIVRDLRLWHRGVPNTSDIFRHMIAMIHHIHWYGRKQKVLYQAGCEAAFVSEDLDHNAEFVDEPLDYLYDRRATRRSAR